MDFNNLTEAGFTITSGHRPGHSRAEFAGGKFKVTTTVSDTGLTQASASLSLEGTGIIERRAGTVGDMVELALKWKHLYT